MHVDGVRRLAALGAANGAKRTGLITSEWDISGNCQAPVAVEVFARPGCNHRSRVIKWTPRIVPTWSEIPFGNEEPDMMETRMEGVLAPGQDKHVTIVSGVTEAPQRVLMNVRCRKCEACLRLRAYVWRTRARAETAMWSRTWFGTLTLTPEAHDFCLRKARQKGFVSENDYDAQSEKERFIGRHRIVNPWLTKWLKRIRKNSGARLRYLLVAEVHESGLPHYHCLVHEVAGTVGERELRKAWPHGFSKFKLVTEPRQAIYLCKYLSKTNAARVRASVGYGNGL